MQIKAVGNKIKRRFFMKAIIDEQTCACADVVPTGV